MAYIIDLISKEKAELKKSTTVGKENCDLTLPLGKVSQKPNEYKSLSKKHVEIFREGDDYFLRDLNSENGTKIERNGKKFSFMQGLNSFVKEKLQNKDKLILGEYPLEVKIQP